MPFDVVCLRPLADFQRVGVTPPTSLTVTYTVPDDPQLAALVRSARALLMPAAGSRLSPSLFEGSNLKLVQVTGAGVDRLDEPTMKKLGIPVANVPGGSNSAVAEYVVTCASMLLRRFGWADAEIRAGRFDSFRARMLADNLTGLEGLTVGVVGFGVIGLAVAQAFHRFGCGIIYFDPAPRDARAAQQIGARAVPLEELLRSADIVTLHVPLLPKTRNLVGAQQLSQMKPGAVLIHTARGGIVDERALAAHLAAGRLGGAAVDVYSTEPLDGGNPLLALDGEAARRLLLTPHIAGVTRQSFATLFREAWSNVERVLVRDETPQNRVY